MFTSRFETSRVCLFAFAVFSLAFSLLAPSRASAEVLCRCAYRPLDSVACGNELTAKVTVLWKKRTKTGDVYVAEVKKVFSGEAERWDLIDIEVPANCGHELRVGKTYAVSLNTNEDTGNYTTFACSTFVKEWRTLEQSELETLAAPVCEPEEPAVANEGEICYQHIESDATQSVDLPCAEGLKCVNKSTRFGFNSTHFCEPENWCSSDATVDNDCQGVVHIAVPGAWTCAENVCHWQVQSFSE
jgi:hypothetical protein